MNEQSAAVKKRLCTRCSTEKSVSEFYRGYMTECKNCARARVNKHRSENVDYIRWYDRQRGLLPQRQEKAKKYLQENPDQRRVTNRGWGRRNRKKRAVEATVARALNNGTIRKLPCSNCGSENSEAHHEDYDKPLDVVWLCRKHHRARHAEIQNQQRINQNPAVENFTRRRTKTTV